MCHNGAADTELAFSRVGRSDVEAAKALVFFLIQEHNFGRKHMGSIHLRGMGSMFLTGVETHPASIWS